MSKDRLEVPEALVARVRGACAHLPEAHEERTFPGVRWRIRGRTLAHVETRLHDHGPVTCVTVHATSDEIEALVAMGDPFLPGWGGGLLAVVLREDGSTDWEEVKELITESYCLLAPKKLIALLGDARPEA